MKTIDPNNVSIKELHSYLLGAIAPRPIAFASTIDENGVPNLSPFSFFNVFGANPPTIVFSPARRVKDNTTKHTLINVEANKEVVINIVTYSMVQQMSLSSSDYPADVNEFEKAGFTTLSSEEIAPFRVAESPVQFECKVKDIIYTGDEGGAGNLIICNVVKVHIDENVLDEKGQIDQYKIDLVARAGGNFYTRARDGFFEIPKPLTTLGIGVDNLPDEIKNSTILTGNNLGMLANVESLPSQQNVDNFLDKHVQLKSFNIEKKHRFAQLFLEENDVKSAWCALLVNN